MVDFKHNHALREMINDHLRQLTRIENSKKTLTSAAVAIAVVSDKESGLASILLTRRSSNLRKHAGQFALPGGKVDQGESLEQAALRELSEELNLYVDTDNVIGLLDDFPTESGFCITPVVVWVEDHTQMKANPGEVAAIYEIPLEELKKITLGISSDSRGDEIEPASDENRYINSTDQSVMSVYLPTVGTTVYSPTAAIIYQFREVALAGKSTRVSHFRQPRFAWR